MSGRVASRPIASGIGWSSRPALLLQIAGLLALTGILLAWVSPRGVLGGSAGIKLLFLLRLPLLLLVATACLRQRGRGWAALGLRRLRPRRAMLMVVVGVIALLVLTAAVRAVLDLAGPGDPHLLRFDLVRRSWAEYLFWAGPVAWGSAGLGEEMLFRGFLLDSLLALCPAGRRWSVPLALALQAACFGLLHGYQGLGGVIMDGCVGLLMGGLWLASGRNLWPAIIVHGLSDSLSMTAIRFGWVTA